MIVLTSTHCIVEISALRTNLKIGMCLRAGCAGFTVFKVIRLTSVRPNLTEVTLSLGRLARAVLSKLLAGSTQQATKAVCILVHPICALLPSDAFTLDESPLSLGQCYKEVDQHKDSFIFARSHAVYNVVSILS